MDSVFFICLKGVIEVDTLGRLEQVAIDCVQVENLGWFNFALDTK